MTQNQISLPKAHITVIYIISAIILSQVTMYLDNARGAAYIIVPLALWHTWCLSANIRWSVDKRIATLAYIGGVLYCVLGFLMLAVIISIEDGNPIITDGPVYEIAHLLARP